MAIVRPIFVAAAVGALAALPTTAARAEGPPEAAGDAEALFKEGRRLFDERKLDEACAKLAESQRLRPDINTVGLLAACREEQGRLAAAARSYVETERRAREAGDRRAEFARQKIEELRPKVGSLKIRVAAPEAGLKVTRAGEVVPEAELGADVFVDPGTIEVTARAPGKRAWLTAVDVGAGERKEIEIPVLALGPVSPAGGSGNDAAGKGASGNGAGGNGAGSRGNNGGSDTSGSGPWRTVGFVVGGLGVVGIGLGAGFGFAAISKTNASLGPELCDEQSRCTPEGGELRDQARSFALVSTIGFVAGLASLGGGVAMLLASGGSASKEPAAPAVGSLRIAPVVAPGALGASMSGTFGVF